jgi:hypothetical protein
VLDTPADTPATSPTNVLKYSTTLLRCMVPSRPPAKPSKSHCSARDTLCSDGCPTVCIRSLHSVMKESSSAAAYHKHDPQHTNTNHAQHANAISHPAATAASLQQKLQQHADMRCSAPTTTIAQRSCYGVQLLLPVGTLGEQNRWWINQPMDPHSLTSDNMHSSAFTAEGARQPPPCV